MRLERPELGKSVLAAHSGNIISMTPAPLSQTKPKSQRIKLLARSWLISTDLQGGVVLKKKKNPGMTAWSFLGPGAWLSTCPPHSHYDHNLSQGPTTSSLSKPYITCIGFLRGSLPSTGPPPYSLPLSSSLLSLPLSPLCLPCFLLYPSFSPSQSSS